MPVSAPPADSPTHFYVPDGARFTIADEVADLAEAVGYDIAEPERHALRALLPQAADGDWIGLESGIVAPRQNLKTATMIACALHDTFVQGVERVVWTAHEFKTSSDAFRDFRQIIEGHDWLASEVLAIRTANGKEGFDLRNGARLDVLARTGKSGRGMASPRLYLDEALYLQGQMIGSIIPIMSARPNAHIVYGSSPGLPSSRVLRELRERGRSGRDPYLGWIEWSQDQQPCADERCLHRPGTPGCWLDDMDAVLAVNCAAGRRISHEYLEQERLTLASAPVEYLRERMGVWEDPATADDGLAFPPAGWDECAAEDMGDPLDLAATVLVVDVSWDRATASVGAAWRAEDGVTCVRVVASMDPSQVVEWMAARSYPQAVGLQSQGAPVSSLLAELQALPINVVPMTGADMAKACGSMFDAIRSRMVRHDGDPHLRQQVAVAVPKRLGDGFALDRVSSPLDVSGLTAVTGARYLLTITDEPADPGVWFL